MNRFTRQRGASFTQILLVLIVGGIFFSVGFKLFTPYADHATISSIIEDISLDQDTLKKPIKDINRDIQRRFTINQVRLPRSPDGEDPALRITEKERVLTFTLDYETRVPMFYNVDAVVVFKEEFVGTRP